MGSTVMRDSTGKAMDDVGKVYTPPGSREAAAYLPTQISMNSQQLAAIVDDVVTKAVIRVEQLFNDQKKELEAKEISAEKALQTRLKKLKKERAQERKELVEMIREMALELEERDPQDVEEPVVLKDAVGRKFVFPYEKCKTWKGFSDLVKQAFLHVDGLGQHVDNGYFDILSPKGFVILPSVWDSIIEPGWEISMHIWPMSEPWVPSPPPVPAPPPPPGVEFVEDRRDWQDRSCVLRPAEHKGHRLDDIVEEVELPRCRKVHPPSLESSRASVTETVTEADYVEKKHPEDEEDQAGEWDVVDD
ncbi:hypothetical protein ACLMJK_007758 [Lecanora helva]